MVYDLHHEVEVEAEEDQLEVVLEDRLDEGVELAVEFVVALERGQVLAYDALEDELADMREGLVVVVLADGEVDVPA